MKVNELIMSRHGLALIQKREGEEPAVLMQAQVEQILGELGLEGLLAWAMLGTLRDIHGELRSLNERAQSAREAPDLSDSLENLTKSFPALAPMLDQLRRS